MLRVHIQHPSSHAEGAYPAPTTELPRANSSVGYKSEGRGEGRRWRECTQQSYGGRNVARYGDLLR
eukprot:6686127-Prymnesium_polylepis.1